jgi:tetratricopeptide (TPR) repeat protein
LYKFEWNWPEAERQFRRALELNPNYALAHHWFGEFLVLRGRPDEGLVHLHQALTLEPLSLSTRNDLARALYCTRRYDEAIREAQHVLNLDPTFSNSYETLTYAYEQKHDYAQAVNVSLQFARISGVPETQLAALRTAFAKSGWQAYWAARVDLLKKAPPGSVPAYVFAEDYLRAGNRGEALHYLEESFDDRGDAPLLIGTEPLLDPLRTDPRFAYLLRRAGFQ